MSGSGGSVSRKGRGFAAFSLHVAAGREDQTSWRQARRNFGTQPACTANQGAANMQLSYSPCNKAASQLM